MVNAQMMSVPILTAEIIDTWRGRQRRQEICSHGDHQFSGAAKQIACFEIRFRNYQ